MKTNQRTITVIASVSFAAILGCHASTNAAVGLDANLARPSPTNQTVLSTAESASTYLSDGASETSVPKYSGESRHPNNYGKVTLRGVQLTLPGNLVYETGKATLRPNEGNEAVLDELRRFLENTPKITSIRIEGHTDDVGNAEDNLELSGQRALTVKKWLIEKGITKERLLAVGFGEQLPIVCNSSESGRAQNRRTEFKVATFDGKNYLERDPIGGGQVFE